MLILGISAFYHDSAVALVRDGEIVFAAQEERFSRKKNDEAFPRRAVLSCFKECKVSIKDIDYVAFYDKPLLKFERILETYLSVAPEGLASFIKAMPVWLKEKLWMKQLLRKELGFTGPIIFPEHHQSHGASAFYPSPFLSSAFLTVDGVGEWATSSYGVGQGNSLTTLAEMHFPHSLGLLYSAITYYTGFKVNSGEYKVMGLAPYGEPKYKKMMLDNLIDLKSDGSFRLNMRFFNFHKGLTMTTPAFHQLFGGEPRQPETLLTQKDMDLARSVQEVTEEIILKMVRHIHKITGEDNLCLAGGVALNCVANGRILSEGPFKNIWIQPAAGDAGGALGAALFTWFEVLGNQRRVSPGDLMKGAYLGPSFSDEEIEAVIRKHKLKFVKLSPKALITKIAKELSLEKVVGWFQGKMEFGPRALGNRSIIGDARSPKMQETMNLKIKFRESFRPFAPAVMAEKTTQYFDLKGPSPYMLLVAQVKKKLQKKMTQKEQSLFGIDKLNVVRSTIPAVTHVDYSARVQTVHPETNPLFSKLLQEFERLTECAVLINTSFNVRGEPIVCTPEDAVRCFMRTDIDYLVMGSYVIDKADQKPNTKDENWKKEFTLD